MIQRLLVHGTQIRGARRVAPFAPARPIAHGRVVVHLLAKPTGRAAVAGIAIHRRATHQLCGFRYMVGRLGQGTLCTRRQIASVVARLTGSGRHNTVVHGHRTGKADLRLVAGVTLGNASGNRNVCWALFDSTGAAVMAVVTGACTDGIGWRVRVLHTQPAAGGSMTTLAVSGYRRVGCRSGLAGQAIACAQVTRCTLGIDRHIHVETTRAPAGVARLVAAVAVGDGNTRESLVRNMVDRLSIRWRIGSTVASGALVGH